VFGKLVPRGIFGPSREGDGEKGIIEELNNLCHQRMEEVGQMCSMVYIRNAGVYGTLKSENLKEEKIGRSGP
jgi:hypothetical protein